MDGLKLVAINAMGNTEYLIGAHKWLGLKSIAMVESQREMNGKVSIEQRYYILSIHSDVQRFATAVRSHWSIENQLHWILDVGFAEDAAQSCQGYSAENLAVIRHVGINLLSRDKQTKVGVKTKRLKAGWDDNYSLPIKQVCEQIANPVLAVLDREYGNASWVLAQVESKADGLMRVRKNACFWSAPPAYGGRGRPRKHGQKMKLNDPETWMEADTILEIDHHPQLGQVRVTQWQNLHFYRAASHLVNLILIERIKPMSNGQPFPPLWLAWVGARTLPLEQVWFQYLRRFGVDH